MPDNLTVTIGADSSKLLADLKLAQAAVKSLNTEMNALTKTAQQSGDRTAVDALSPKIIAAQKEVVRLNTAWKEVAPSVNTATRSVGIFADVSNRELIKLSRNFGNLNKTAETFGVILGGAFGGFTGGLFARAISSTFGALITQLDEASKRLTALQQQARQAGVKPIAVQAAGEAAEQAGLDAEAGEKAFASFAKTIAEARASIGREDTRGVSVQRGPGATPVSGAAVNDAQSITEMDAAAKQAAGSIRVLRGNMADSSTQMDGFAKALRGGIPDIKNFSDALGVLGIDPGRVKPDDIVKTYELAIKRLLTLAQQFPSQMNVVSQKLFEMPLADIQDIANDAEKLDALIKKLAATQRGATNERLAANKRLLQSQKEVDAAYKETGSTLDNMFRDSRIAFNKLQTEVIKAFPQALRDMFDFRVLNEAARLFGVVGSAVESLWNKFKEFVNWLSTTFSSTIGVVAKAFADAWTASFNWVANKISGLIGWFKGLIGMANQAAAAASNAASGGTGVGAAGGAATGGGGALMGTASAGTPGTSGYQAAPAQVVSPTGADQGGFGVSVYRGGSGNVTSSPSVPLTIETGRAGGGYIRGRGTGTSDSILARLSNGEFVLNAGSVRRLGVGFLEGLNSFAAGGLVSPLPRFAAGGLVGGGGTPVHLHLGGHSFALSGSESVVGSLVVEAHRHKIRSAGVKPSWYGGTPGR